jgi:hypothetical protein
MSKKIILLTSIFSLVSVLAISGCQLDPIRVNPAQAAKYNLISLNDGLKGPQTALPKGPVIFTGYVVSKYNGPRQALVLGLSPTMRRSSNKTPEIAWCLFEEFPAGENLSPGALVTVAGLLDSSSAPDNLVLTAATLVQVIKP